MHRKISFQVFLQMGGMGFLLSSIVTAQTSQPTPSESVIPISVEDLLADTLSKIDQWDQQGRLVVDAEEAEKLNESITLIQQQEPSHPWLSYLIARSFALVGRRHDAIDHMQIFVRTREGRNEWRAYRFLGDLFVESFPRLAKTNYEKAAALQGSDPDVKFGLSRCAYRMGDFAGSIRLAQDAVDLDRHRSIRYVSQLSRSAAIVKKWDLALSSSITALSYAKEKAQDQPGDTPTLIQVNVQYQIVIDILQARLSDTDNTEILSSGYVQLADIIAERAAIAEKLSHHDVVRVLASAVTRTSPDTPVSLLERYGIALENVGRKEEAIIIYQDILRQNAAHESVKQRLKRLQTD